MPRIDEEIVKIAGLACVFLACVAQAPRLPGIGAEDLREPVSLEAPPFKALGRVQTELGARCTGFLIAPGLVMTAAHCLFLPKPNRFVQPTSVHVLLGYRAGAYRAHAQAVSFRIAPGYQPRSEAQSAGVDRAILVLDHPIGGVGDVLPLAALPAAPFPVMLAGYGQDRDELAVGSRTCSVRAMASDGEGRPLLAHDCQATAGTSGAPLVMRRPDGSWAAVGVQIEARVRGAGGLAVPALDATPTDRSAGR